jgi:hypothetical protein
MVDISLPFYQEISCSGWSIFGYQNPILLVNFMLSKPERKNQDYPHIREYILKYQLSFSGDTITLTVGTAPVPNIIQRGVSAG